MLILRQVVVSGRSTLTALKRPFFIFQSFVLHKNGVEIRQEENGIIILHLNKLYEFVRRCTKYMMIIVMDDMEEVIEKKAEFENSDILKKRSKS